MGWFSAYRPCPAETGPRPSLPPSSRLHDLFFTFHGAGVNNTSAFCRRSPHPPRLPCGPGTNLPAGQLIAVHNGHAFIHAVHHFQVHSGQGRFIPDHADNGGRGAIGNMDPQLVSWAKTFSTADLLLAGAVLQLR